MKLTNNKESKPCQRGSALAQMANRDTGRMVEYYQAGNDAYLPVNIKNEDDSINVPIPYGIAFLQEQFNVIRIQPV
jgi:hypothetical protein